MEGTSSQLWRTSPSQVRCWLRQPLVHLGNLWKEPLRYPLNGKEPLRYPLNGKEPLRFHLHREGHCSWVR